MDVILIKMTGKTGIRIPSHNSLTPSFLDELLKMVTTSRKKPVDAHRIRRRLPEKHHIAIVSTGLSYLAYLGPLKKVPNGYKPSRLGKKIGKLLARDRTDEANVVWNELLKRHRLSRVFRKFFSSRYNKHGTTEDFSLYLQERAHAKWKISAIRSRVSRLCELFAEKGLIEYQNGHLSPLDQEEKELKILSISSDMPIQSKPALSTSSKDISLDDVTARSSQATRTPISISTDAWPIKIEMKIEVSDRANPEVVAMILSFLNDLKKTCTPVHSRRSER